MRLELVQGCVMKILFTLIFLHGEIIYCLLLFSIHDSFPLGMCRQHLTVLLVFLFLCAVSVLEDPCFFLEF